MKTEIKSFNEIEQEDFIQWAKDTGRIKEELSDVYVKNDGELKIEKKMCWVMKTSPNEYKQFCKDTGREFEEIKILAYMSKLTTN